MPRDPHPLASVAQILSTPSSQDDIPTELENDLRVVGCMMIQEAGIMLGLPQSTMATAQVVFHRFFYVSSMAAFGINDLSVSCLYLATKLNETPVRLRDLINTYMYLQARIRHILSHAADEPLVDRSRLATAGGPSLRLGESDRDNNGFGKGKEKEKDPALEGFKFDVPSSHSPVFWEWKEAIQYNELQILKRLGFNMQVDLPYSHVINYLKILDLVFQDNVAQMCWSILNDALLTPLYAQQPTHVLAVASILLTARLLRIPLPDGWYLLFDVQWDDVWPCCGTIVQLWREWAVKPVPGMMLANGAPEQQQRTKEDRWRRAWLLAESRSAIRTWIKRRADAQNLESNS